MQFKKKIKNKIIINCIQIGMTQLVSRLISINIWSMVWYHIMYITMYVCIKKIMYLSYYDVYQNNITMFIIICASNIYYDNWLYAHITFFFFGTSTHHILSYPILYHILYVSYFYHQTSFWIKMRFTLKNKEPYSNLKEKEPYFQETLKYLTHWLKKIILNTWLRTLNIL